MEEAPSIEMESPLPIEKEIEPIELLVEKKFNITSENEKYILTCSQTNKSTIYIKLELQSELKTYFYSFNYELKSLIKISKLFFLCSDIEDSFKILIDNLSKNYKDIKVSFSKNYIKLILSFDLPTGKKEDGYFILNKKEININDVLNSLNSKLNLIKENQEKFERKIEEKMNEIISKQNNIENDLKSYKLKNNENGLEKEKN